MLVSATAEAARKDEKTYDIDGQLYIGRDYIGTAPKPGTPGYGRDMTGEDFPQAYLVIQPPHSVTRPHFHRTNQFQVFVGGSGTVGKIRTDPVTVQYAGGHTPYGPIRAEADGIHYFTLRPRWDSGARYLPEQRDALDKGQQRQRIGLPDRTGGADRQALFEAESDGLAAEYLRLDPGACAELPDAAAGDGQYHIVLSGSLLRDGAALPPLSVEYASPGEGRVRIEAGGDGLELLYLRFPRPE